MDETIDALASRLNGRDLVDEVLGYFRSHRSNGSDDGHHVQERVTDTARSVVGMIREHPLPAALIGSGIAWMLYERMHEDEDAYDEYDLLDDDASQQMLFDEEYDDAPGRFGSEDEESRAQRLKEQAGSGVSDVREGVTQKAGDARERMASARHRIGARSGNMAHRARSRARGMRGRAGRAGGRIGHGARGVLHQGRDQLDRHPLEAGLISLAGGLIAGLLTPNPDQLDEMAGPAARKLEGKVRRRAREAMGRGRHVASVAAETARHEAAEQGLTPEALKEGAEHVFDETRHAAQQTAREEAEAEGLTPNALKDKAKSVAKETKDAARETARGESDDMSVEVRDEMSTGGTPRKDV